MKQNPPPHTVRCRRTFLDLAISDIEDINILDWILEIFPKSYHILFEKILSNDRALQKFSIFKIFGEVKRRQIYFD